MADRRLSSKKTVTISLPRGSAAADEKDAENPSSSAASRRPSMGPRGCSLRAFTPAHRSGDEDDRYDHSDDADDPNDRCLPVPAASSFRPKMTLHPFTRPGRLALFGHHRRWINFAASWSRIGAGSTELSASVGESGSGASVLTGCRQEEGKTVRALLAQLCEHFYKAGWATGTGGGTSIRVGGPAERRPWRVFVAPSGLQKEDMVGDDMFEMDMDQSVVQKPKTPGLRLSACTPLWFVVFKHRPSVKCVIHTHSVHAVMATLLDAGERSPALKVTHLEMLKGVGNHAYDDVLEIPIIDNRPTEDKLADQMEEALQSYPKCNAVLVRRHGAYVWGDSWEQAKAQCESFHYLFECAVKMRSLGVDCGLAPTGGTYHAESLGQNRTIDVLMKRNIVDCTDCCGPMKEEEKEDSGGGSPPSKKMKAEGSADDGGSKA